MPIFLACTGLYAQLGYVFDDVRPGALTCAWERVPLRSQPGKTGPYVSHVYFGERVEKMGQEAYMPEEKRTYLQVRSADGKIGWVHEYLFIEGGMPAVVLQEGRIYERPNTPSTITAKSFEPGELVVFEAHAGEWISLIGKEKSKKGWIKGAAKISSDTKDIELAAMLESARKEKDATKRQEKLATLLADASQSQSPLRPLINSYVGGQTTTQASHTARTQVVLPRFEPNMRTRSVEDPQSGRLYNEVLELGSVAEVAVPAAGVRQFAAYHKTLPPGSSVFLQLPYGGGLVELKVQGGLPVESPHALGLSKETIDLLFGSSLPAEVAFTYLLR
ncbi:MAG: hypothetical protein OHK0039_19180 [Bacteroidia bacterium]